MSHDAVSDELEYLSGDVPKFTRTDQSDLEYLERGLFAVFSIVNLCLTVSS